MSYHVEGQQGLPDSMKMAVWNPQTGAAEVSDNGRYGVAVGAGSTEYRLVAAGGSGFLSGLNQTYPGWSLALLKPYPNPFRRSLAIRFTLPYSGIGRVKCSIFDGRGRVVWSMNQPRPNGGLHLVTWDGSTSSSRSAAGMYLIRLQAFNDKGLCVKALEQRAMFMP